MGDADLDGARLRSMSTALSPWIAEWRLTTDAHRRLHTEHVICGVNRSCHLGGCSEIAAFSVTWSLSGRPLQTASSMG